MIHSELDQYQQFPPFYHKNDRRNVNKTLLAFLRKYRNFNDEY